MRNYRPSEVTNVDYSGKRIKVKLYAGLENILGWLEEHTKHSSRLVCIDIETYAHEAYKDHDMAAVVPAKARIRTVQVYDGTECAILDLLDKEEGDLLEDVEVVDKLYAYLHKHTLLAHNALFETAHLQKVFHTAYTWVDPLHIICTMNMFRLVLCASTPFMKGVNASLGHLTKELLDYDMPKELQASDWSVPVLTTDHLRYCALDVITCFDLFYLMLPRIKELGLTKVLTLNTEAQEPVAHMRVMGIGFDYARHEELIKEWKVERDAALVESISLMNNELWLPSNEVEDILLARIPRIAVTDVKARIKCLPKNTAETKMCDAEAIALTLLDLEAILTDPNEMPSFKKLIDKVIENIKRWLLMPGSNKDKGDFVNTFYANLVSDWPRTPTGALSFDGDHLAKLQAPVFQAWTKFADYNKLYATYGVGFREFVLRKTKCGYIFPSFSLCFTETGRMSSFQPNLQNLPTKAGIRGLFVARANNRKLLCADFSQIELRVAALLSQDPVMLDAYETGKDLHTITTETISGKTESMVNKDEWKDLRRHGKAINFGLLYGAGAKTLCTYAEDNYGIKYTEEQSKQYVDDWRGLYAGYRAYQLQCADAATESLTSTTRLGKLRALDETKAYTTSINHPVQGAAAEVMLKAICLIWGYIQEHKLDCYVVNVVHDEILLDCHDDDVTEAAQALKEAMISAFKWLFPEANVDTLVESVAVGSTWAEVK